MDMGQRTICYDVGDMTGIVEVDSDTGDITGSRAHKTKECGLDDLLTKQLPDEVGVKFVDRVILERMPLRSEWQGACRLIAKFYTDHNIMFYSFSAGEWKPVAEAQKWMDRPEVKLLKTQHERDAYCLWLFFNWQRGRRI
jgi:hypothetical protein